MPHSDLPPRHGTLPAEEEPAGLWPASGLTSLVGSIRAELERGQEIRALSARRRSVQLKAVQVGVRCFPPLRGGRGVGRDAEGMRGCVELSKLPGLTGLRWTFLIVAGKLVIRDKTVGC